MNKLRKQIENLINKNSLENGSNTPDFILAEYLANTLKAFDKAVNHREGFYNRNGNEIDEVTEEWPLDEFEGKSVEPVHCGECGEVKDVYSNILASADKEINFDGLLHKFGPEGVSLIADKLKSLADEDFHKGIEQSLDS